MTEKVDEVNILSTVREKYKLYSTYILGFRHFAEGRDGLKPVQRRALWAMRRQGATDGAHAAKTAAVAGMTMGLYHPHEDGSISAAMAKMTQANLCHPLILGVGNWGSHDQPPAAPRYTSCYLSPYAMTMFDPDELGCVPMDSTYDGKNEEPRFLPVCLPHLLIGGCVSLASAYKGDIPPCPPNWVAECVERTMLGKPLRIPRAMSYRWGGALQSLDREWLDTGAGTGEFQPVLSVSDGAVLMHSLAPGLSALAVDIRLQDDPAFAGSVEESPLPGDAVRIVLRVKRGHSPAEFADRALKLLSMKKHFSFLQICQKTGKSGDVEYDPVIEGPTSFLMSWVKWRLTVVSGAAKRRAATARAGAARADLMLRVIDKRRELLSILDQSKTRDEIRTRTAKLLSCTLEQATDVMGISWPRLARLEAPALHAEKASLLKAAINHDKVARQPSSKMSSDASQTVSAIEQSMAAATAMLTRPAKVGKKRRAQ